MEQQCANSIAHVEFQYVELKLSLKYPPTNKTLFLFLIKLVGLNDADLHVVVRFGNYNDDPGRKVDRRGWLPTPNLCRDYYAVRWRKRWA